MSLPITTVAVGIFGLTSAIGVFVSPTVTTLWFCTVASSFLRSLVSTFAAGSAFPVLRLAPHFIENNGVFLLSLGPEIENAAPLQHLFAALFPWPSRVRRPSGGIRTVLHICYRQPDGLAASPPSNCNLKSHNHQSPRDCIGQ